MKRPLVFVLLCIILASIPINIGAAVTHPVQRRPVPAPTRCDPRYPGKCHPIPQPPKPQPPKCDPRHPGKCVPLPTGTRCDPKYHDKCHLTYPDPAPYKCDPKRPETCPPQPPNPTLPGSNPKPPGPGPGPYPTPRLPYPEAPAPTLAIFGFDPEPLGPHPEPPGPNSTPPGPNPKPPGPGSNPTPRLPYPDAPAPTLAFFGPGPEPIGPHPEPPGPQPDPVDGSPCRVAPNRQGITAAAMWAAKSGKYINYSQGRSRWSGITKKICPYQGVPSVTDCSAFVTWLYWSAFGNGKDFLNNQGWKAGYTGSMGSNGTPVSLAQAKPGDVVLYGSHPYHHATLYVGNNQVVSFGANGPAKLLPINYRGDYHVRSYLP